MKQKRRPRRVASWPSCSLAKRVVKFSLLSFLLVSSTSAIDAELHGFAEGRFGMRTQNDPHEDDRSLTELRLQLDSKTYLDGGEFSARGDFVYDELAADIQKINLATGTGFIDLRELNLLFTPIDWVDVKVGRQILTWGTGDLLFINDLFPKDWNSFLLGRDEEYLKAPSDAVFASFFPRFGTIDLAYSPTFDADRLVDGSRVSYWNGTRLAGQDAVVRTDRPNDWFEDDEVSARYYRDIKGYETALYIYHGFWKSPAGFDMASGKATFPALNVYGASTKGAFKGGILNMEAGYYDSREDHEGDDPTVANSQIRFLTGYDRELAKDFSGGIQYYAEVMIQHNRYKKGMANPADEVRHVLTLRLTKMLMNQNLTIGVFTFYSPSDNDAYIRPTATYKLTDQWKLTASGGLFFGEDKHTFFGQFRDNSNVSLGVRYSF